MFDQVRIPLYRPLDLFFQPADLIRKVLTRRVTLSKTTTHLDHKIDPPLPGYRVDHTRLFRHVSALDIPRLDPIFHLACPRGSLSWK